MSSFILCLVPSLSPSHFGLILLLFVIKRNKLYENERQVAVEDLEVSITVSVHFLYTFFPVKIQLFIWYNLILLR